jgi:hypothetical protein
LDPEIYRERLRLGIWTTLALGLLMCALTPLAALQLFAISREPLLIWLYGGLDLIFVAVYLNFRALTVSITESDVRVAFGLIRKTVRVEDVASVEPVTTSFGMYGGYGIRFGGDGALAFTVSYGDGVRIRLTRGRPFVFTTENQGQVLELLNGLIKPAADRE